MPKHQVVIHLSRRITLQRNGHEPIELNQGMNTVDADVAAHPFVKAHTVSAAPDHSDELIELRAKLADITKERDDAGAALIELRNALDAAGARNAELTIGYAAAVERATDVEEKFAQKVADMDALVASMTPAAEAKPTKAKG